MNLAEDEAHAIGQIRRFLSYLPASVWEAPPVVELDDQPDRREESLISAVPRNRRRIYDPRLILDAVLDQDSFFEIGLYYGRARVTGLARVMGVMANNPKYNGGSMDIATGEKTIRLIELCDTFHLPLVYFADEPGFSVGKAQEELGIVRAGARVVTTLTQSKTPYVCFVLRQLYGVAGGLHQRGGNGLYRRYCWPSTHGGSMHIEAARPSPTSGISRMRPTRRRGARRSRHACRRFPRRSATRMPSASRRSSTRVILALAGGLHRRRVEGRPDAVGAGERPVVQALTGASAQRATNGPSFSARRSGVAMADGAARRRRRASGSVGHQWANMREHTGRSLRTMGTPIDTQSVALASDGDLVGPR